jgi:hypothetical protein
MAIINLLSIASRNRPNTNPLLSASVTVPAGVTRAEFSITTNSQPAPNTTWLGDATQGFVLFIERTQDGGATWDDVGGSRDPLMCGIINRDGSHVNPSFTITDMAGQTIRGHLETINGPIRFGLQADTAPAG